VHPGEIPSNHLLEGILDYILKKNTNILEHFVFLIVPMLNPDGVFRGHWRVDTLG
jgi:murein tripeptide amidase MpaA